MILLLALGAMFALASAVPMLVPRLGRDTGYALALGFLGVGALLLTTAPVGLAGGTVEGTWRWLPTLGVEFALRIDGLAALFCLLVLGVGALIMAYCPRYLGEHEAAGPVYALLTVFAGAMLGLVLAADLVLLYVFWELTTVTSFFLIKTAGAKAGPPASRALLVTAGGGLALLVAVVLTGLAAGTTDLATILASPELVLDSPFAGAIGALLVVAAFTKSAQLPFQFWLPGAMVAMTPVSAYLHAATMVKAGVYLIARLAPAFAGAVGYWRPVVITAGLATMVVGGYRALRQHDLKLLLAFGTVSQLGLMVVLVGAGHPDLTFAGAVLILAHSLFKAALFLIVGIVDHQAHTRDLRVLTGLRRRMPATFAVAAVAAASMAGIPPLLGFVSKEAVYEALLHAGSRPGDVLTLAGVVAGSILTFAYGARFLWGGFATKTAPSLSDPVGPAVPPPSGPFLAPAAVLAALTVVAGLAPMLATGLVEAAASSLDPSATPPHLTLWHGFTPALALSVVTVALGAAMFSARSRVERLQERLRVPVSALGAYQGSVSGLTRVAARTTGIVQNGSLPTYIGVILLTVLLLPGITLVRAGGLPSDLVLAESPLQAAVGALVIVAAVAAARARRRFTAVLFLGGVGYGVAVLFLIQGAPDLALTQFLIETLALVIFVLVLRHLPDRFEPAPWRLREGARWVIAGGMGAFVAVFVLVAAAARTQPPVSDEYLARALPEGGGRNVVNVILTDFRGLDTMGEITVLLVAGVGIASLVMAGWRRGEQR